MTRSNKSLADAIGLPDEEDRKRIMDRILKYEHEHPGEIIAIRDHARQLSKATKNKHGVVNEESRRRYLFELPEELGHWMGQAYPLMFREPSHTRWFAKNFKELLIPERY